MIIKVASKDKKYMELIGRYMKNIERHIFIIDGVKDACGIHKDGNVVEHGAPSYVKRQYVVEAVKDTLRQYFENKELEVDIDEIAEVSAIPCITDRNENKSSWYWLTGSGVKFIQ